MLRRLEKRILVPLPSHEARRNMFEHLLTGRCHPDVTFDHLASKTEGYSGRLLACAACGCGPAVKGHLIFDPFFCPCFPSYKRSRTSYTLSNVALPQLAFTASLRSALTFTPAHEVRDPPTGALALGSPLMLGHFSCIFH
jgi:hypothetical protein